MNNQTGPYVQDFLHSKISNYSLRGSTIVYSLQTEKHCYQANLQSFLKVIYPILFPCIDHIPLSFKWANIKTYELILKHSYDKKKGVLKLDYYWICFYKFINISALKYSVYLVFNLVNTIQSDVFYALQGARHKKKRNTSPWMRLTRKFSLINSVVVFVDNSLAF